MKIVLIGSGNLAFHLGPALLKAGHTIVQLIGRSDRNTAKLAKKLDCPYSIQTEYINVNTDVYIIAVSDNAIKSFAKQIPKNDKLVLHTSGTVNANVLEIASKHYGVIYPVQTFSTDRKIKFNTVPLCLEASTEIASRKLKKLSSTLSDKIHWISHEQRQVVHLAAVFSNNFSNHLFVIAEELLNKSKLDFNMLRPLIAETAAKIQQNTPGTMQTGPAKRGDSETINKHIALLKNNKQISKIYEVITQDILDHNAPRL